MLINEVKNIYRVDQKNYIDFVIGVDFEDERNERYKMNENGAVLVSYNLKGQAKPLIVLCDGDFEHGEFKRGIEYPFTREEEYMIYEYCDKLYVDEVKPLSPYSTFDWFKV